MTMLNVENLDAKHASGLRTSTQSAHDALVTAGVVIYSRPRSVRHPIFNREAASDYHPDAFPGGPRLGRRRLIINIIQ
ncbi:hypothetical protein GLE_2113 [Lysobacter enzymogenes]|uniref:Uncharacterized protein n=1 Tax=Lysobacter enzymogenes TaxID=69 RepID=A0A0S2DFS5_LYSEN|nr:hypothetical protein GLE_2113 [Lysobacter enzymogenes]